MSHLDEGQLTCLLDGELTATERTEVEAHLATCSECRALLEEIRGFSTEADSLVQAVDLPRPAARPDPARPAAGSHASPTRRPLPWRSLAWAATVMLAVGLGYYARGARPAPTLSDIGANDSATRRPAVVTGTVAQEAAKAPAADAPAPERRAAAAPASPSSTPAEQPAPTPAPAAGAEALTTRDAAGELKVAERSRQAEPQLSPGVTEPAGNALASGSVERREAPAAQAAAPVVAFHQVSMEEAVRTLGGQIRLLDGLTPRRVLAGPGSLLAGSRADAPVVRVVYEDPPGRELWLDQQRTVEEEGRANLAPVAPALLPGDTVLAPAAQGMRSVRWMDQAGFRLALTGFLPADSLRTLLRRVE